MPNPEICDKCWFDYYRREDAPEYPQSETCRGLEGWYCPDPFSSNQDSHKMADPPPPDCPRLFEQSIAMGMKNVK
jgi:hypothetical protein